jgi:predicted  nucleic acid-binding Zn-ribbon protein
MASGPTSQPRSGPSDTTTAPEDTENSEPRHPVAVGLPTKDLNILRDTVKRLFNLEKDVGGLKDNVMNGFKSTNDRLEAANTTLTDKADSSQFKHLKHLIDKAEKERTDLGHRIADIEMESHNPQLSMAIRPESSGRLNTVLTKLEELDEILAKV